MRLLLVDDDAFLLDMYRVKFTESGHEVEVANCGKAALHLVQKSEKPFTAVIMDMVMPEMTGVDLIKALDDEPQAKDAVKIVLSNQGEEQDRESAKRAGADGYIVKADSIPSEVVSRVEKLVKKHS